MSSNRHCAFDGTTVLDSSYDFLYNDFDQDSIVNQDQAFSLSRSSIVSQGVSWPKAVDAVATMNDCILESQAKNTLDDVITTSPDVIQRDVLQRSFNNHHQRESSDSTVVSQHDNASIDDQNGDVDEPEDEEDEDDRAKVEYDYKKIVVGAAGNRFVTNVDVLFGRGGHNAHRIGNQGFLQERNRLYQQYQIASTNSAKRNIQDQLIQFVYNRNGQFLEKLDHNANENGTTRWSVVTNDRKIYRKVAQALREGPAKYNKK